MCGIAGFISLQNKINKDEMVRANNLQKHRGPDAEGYYYSDDGKVALAHRRLSIIDLSVGANQPMYSSDKRYIMVYNGEVYNFKELKFQLKDKGKSLITTSDSEIILELFNEQGTQCFQYFNGMFSIAIYDKQNNVVTLCRDQAGIKPLFYYYDDDNFIFSSEIKTIKSLKNSLTINRDVFPYFLHLGYIPEPLTVYNNVYKFPAAAYLQIDLSSKSFSGLQNNIESYWKMEDKILPQPLTDEKKAKKILHDLLFDSIEKQMISDVPLGTFLSGGIDSSIVTAIASKINGQKVKTFSIAVTDGKVNEAPFAAAVAKELGTEHYELPICEKDVMEMVSDLLNVYDEPFSDSSAFPTMMVSKLARDYVTVALSGDGGDEQFLGYGSYLWSKRLQHPLLKNLSAPIHIASKTMTSKYQRAGMFFEKYPSNHFKSHLFSQDQYFFSENELNSILTNPHFNFDEINSCHLTSRNLDVYEKQSFWDLKNYLKDDLLVKVDRASMRFGLETRVPLLDTRLIEFSLNLSTGLKLKNNISKYLLKEILFDLVPKKLFDRPKWGFGIPLSKWLKTDLNWMIKKYCNKKITNELGIFKHDRVSKLVKQYLSGRDYLYNRIWVIIITHWFIEENG